MKPEDLYWLAGLLEGEGSFMCGSPDAPNRIKVMVQMTDRDVIDRVALIWDSGVYEYKPSNPRHKVTYSTGLGRARAHSMMCLLRPLMGQRRQGQIDLALQSFNPSASLDANRRRRALTDAQVRKARLRYQAGESGNKLAEEYGVFNTGFYRMLRGETYTDVAGATDARRRTRARKLA